MNGRLIIVAMAFCLAGCVTRAAESFRHNSLAELKYEEGARDQVWARALAEFQRRNLLIATCNEGASLMTAQNTVEPCPGTAPEKEEFCAAEVVHQFTMGGGTAILRQNRVISVVYKFRSIEARGGPPRTTELLEPLDQRTHEFLSTIVAGRPERATPQSSSR